jgi:hypothetical protein
MNLFKTRGDPEWTAALPCDANSDEVKAALEELMGVDLVHVSKLPQGPHLGPGRGSGWSGWDITFLPHDVSTKRMTRNGGDLDLLLLDTVQLRASGGAVNGYLESGNESKSEARHWLGGASANVSTLIEGTPVVGGKFKVLFRNYYYRWDEMSHDESAEVLQYTLFSFSHIHFFFSISLFRFTPRNNSGTLF